jgi:threonyl-tRNA synthetase
MRLLGIHADFFRYRATKPTRLAEEVATREDGMEDCCVLFTCVEAGDERDPVGIVLRAADEVLVRLGRIGADRVVVYPYAHLTPALSAPAVALAVLNAFGAALAERGVAVKRAPFGWYKEFEMKGKGHPLADFSLGVCPHSLHDCDASCPFCHHPLRTADLEASDAS